ncbi:hypothetical protein Tco_0656248 [Tanacetum coccineum]|uniref:CCHC-type domain-containing protein n=1 Tax=Tanacetum coccineum TaxID=301880 RepID=A0ABQ4X883_9ASTR
MILNSVKNGPLIWPTIKENGETRKRSIKNSQLQKSSKLTVILKLPTLFFKDYLQMCMLLAIIINLPKRYGIEFAQLINDMHIINMTMRPVQVNTKFLNSLPPEWSKFMMDVKLARDLHTNYDQLYSYLQQHEAHANETRLLSERYQDPVALVANYNQTLSHLNNYNSQYTSPQYPQQTSSTLQQVHSYQQYTPINKGHATSSGANNAGRHAKVVKCYNCQSGGYMAKKCTQPKRPRNAAWFKEKAMLAEAHESGQILDEEQLAFLVDPGITDCYDVQPTIIHNVAFQTDDLDAYDSDCDDISSAKAILMANLSNYDSGILSEIYYSDYQYAVSIKEDTAYPCLHSPKTTKERRSIRRIEDIVCEYSGRYQTWSLLQETPIRHTAHPTFYPIQRIDQLINTAYPLPLDTVYRSSGTETEPKFYHESYDGEDEMLDEGDNWGIDPNEFLSNVNTSFKNHKKVDGRTKKVLFHAWMNGNWNKRRIDDSILRIRGCGVGGGGGGACAGAGTGIFRATSPSDSRSSLSVLHGHQS